MRQDALAARSAPRARGAGQPDAAANQNIPEGIAVDDRFVYWTNHGGGTVLKVAKPK
jgi:hypothetical protein